MRESRAAKIAAYETQQREIIAAIERDGRLHQDVFDAEFNSEKLFGVDFSNVETSIFRNSGNRWLHLLQLMVHAGIVEQSGELPHIVYSMPEKEEQK